MSTLHPHLEVDLDSARIPLVIEYTTEKIGVGLPDASDVYETWMAPAPGACSAGSSTAEQLQSSHVSKCLRERDR